MVGFTSIASPPPILSNFPPSILTRKTFRNGEYFRVWRHRRLKLKPKRFAFRNEFDLSTFLAPSSSAAADVLSVFTFNWVPPAALGFASAVAISLASRRDNLKEIIRVYESDSRVVDVGEWILFTSPSPFNRFIVLRCPSIYSEGGEFMEDVGDKLVKEERHYVRLDSGRIQVRNDDMKNENLEYQRECVRTKDGGVISLDWPSNLDLNDEHGLDSVVLIVPGTVEGSMDENVRGFVCECLRRGLFPVVMNPRGCAGSPLTTARLFTAADSDDICSAIQFIAKARPWSTLLSVGWGYGANMLTKYLAETGEKTPLTAATCIDNPFDLDEASRTTPYSSSLDKKFTGGLIGILKANKGLFQGKSKGFDVEKALLAESVHEFEKAISMVSYGFDSIEDFYSKSSTRSVVEKLKIPVLFVQNDNGPAPVFSIPRAVIAENPFTSLLLCSCSRPNVTPISWYQQVTIEWLTAVELGLLKGRHPLLQDIDVTINPSKGLALMEGRTSYSNDRHNGFYLDSKKEILQAGDSAASSMQTPQQVSQRELVPSDQVFKEANEVSPRTASADSDSMENAGDDPVVNDRGQVLQSTEVVMNMLDVTIPGTLKEAEKKKVLAAVSRGETVMKALQDAVPEDVRGKLTNSVSEILQTQGKNLNFDALLNSNKLADVSSSLRSKLEQNANKNHDIEFKNNEKSTEQQGTENDLGDKKYSSEAEMDNRAEEISGAQKEEKSVKTLDVLDSKSVDNHADDSESPSFPTKSENSNDRLDNESSSDKVGQVYEAGEKGSESNISVQSNSSQDDKVSQIGVKESNISARPGDQQDSSSEPRKTDLPGGSGDSDIAQSNSSQDDKMSQMDDKESNISARPGGQQDSSSDPHKTDSPADTSKAPEIPIPTPEIKVAVTGDNDDKNKEAKSVQADQSKVSDAKTPNFNVSQALDALSGMDDSTQVAVNSVFGVLENMIAQMEEKNPATEDNKVDERIDAENQLITDKTSSSGGPRLENQKNGDNREGPSPEGMDSVNGNNRGDKMENHMTSESSIKKDNRNENLVVNKPSTQNAVKLLNTNGLLSYRTLSLYTEAFYHEDLRKYILSEVQKMKSSYLGTDSTLYLDYNPKEGLWFFLEQPGGDNGVLSCNSVDSIAHSTPTGKESSLENVIEPSYVIEPVEGLGLKGKHSAYRNNGLLELESSVRTVILDSLKVEVSRRLSATDLKDMETGLAADMEEVAKAVCLAVQEHARNFPYSDDAEQAHSKFRGKHVIEAISRALYNTSHLKRVLPVGVIVGSSLVALRKCTNVASVHDDPDAASLNVVQENVNGFKAKGQVLQEDTQLATYEISQHPTPENMPEKEEETTFLDVNVKEKALAQTLKKDTLMAGAVTAAVGATALLRNQQEDFMEGDNNKTTSSNMVMSLAEKAMSVAAPVVPTKEDGGLDQERIVSMLTELGQKGGVLKLVGKLALLWGGFRGAMSLTGRLISFLRLGERPLLQRVLGFMGMVLVLWSPVVVPLLPTIFSNWATHNPSKVAGLACILGLYTAVTILIMLWGKRIRGHEYPLKYYGLDLMSSKKTQELLTGLAGGVVLVLSIHSVNALIGYVNISLPSNLSSSSLDLNAKVKAYVDLFLLAGKAIMTAAGIAFVEELLFRSWLLEEVAGDLGYHPGILLSGLAFALSQRSLVAIPGLWLLSLCLTGARLRKEGSLFVPIGMRTGILASSFILHTGGFLIVQPNSYHWILGMQPLQPFGGPVGLLFTLLLAVIIYPRQPCLGEKFQRIIRA